METQIIQTNNVTVKKKTTVEVHGYVGYYEYETWSPDKQVVLLIRTADGDIEVGQEFELLLRPVGLT